MPEPAPTVTTPSCSVLAETVLYSSSTLSLRSTPLLSSALSGRAVIVVDPVPPVTLDSPGRPSRPSPLPPSDSVGSCTPGRGSVGTTHEGGGGLEGEWETGVKLSLQGRQRVGAVSVLVPGVTV